MLCQSAVVTPLEGKLLVATGRGLPTPGGLFDDRRLRVNLRQTVFIVAWVMSFVAVVALIVRAWDSYVGPIWLKVPILNAGLSALVCAVILWAARPDNPLCIYLFLFGIVWYAGILQAIPLEVPYALGFVFYHVNVIVLAHLALTLPYGRLASKPEVALLVVMYVSTPGIQLLRYLQVRDVIDRSHFGQVTAHYTSWAKVGTYTAIPLIVVAVVLIVRRWLGSSRLQRRSYVIFWLAAASIGLVALIAVFAEFIGDELSQQLVLVGYVAAVTVAPIGVVVGTFAYVTALPEAIDELAGDTQGAVGVMLSHAAGDPSLRLYEWADGNWLDDAGAPVAPDVPPQSMTTLIAKDERWIALLVHDRTLAYQPALMRLCCGMTVIILARRTAERDAARVRRAVNVSLLEGQLEERARVQSRLHDQAQIEIGAMKELVARLHEGWSGAARPPDELTRLDQRIDRHAGHLRSFIKEIYPVILETNGLLYAVRQLSVDMPFQCRVDIPPKTGWPRYLEAVAYFTIAEALANAARHAAATEVTIKAYEVDTTMVVEISDNGVGGAAAGDGLGLAGARNRAESLGGSFEIVSPRGGTSLRLRVPKNSNHLEDQ